MSHCSFTVENALSVRALHEMVSSNRLVNSVSFYCLNIIDVLMQLLFDI